MKRIIAFIIFFHVFVLSISSQVIYPDPVQLPSVEAQSLGQFAEIPVNLHTGQLNIDIPLYTIKSGDIELPISLSYHGGGIKVTDECGAVGLGWTLNAGGVINRIVQGKPDDLHDQANQIYGYDFLERIIQTRDNLNGVDFLKFLDNIRRDQLISNPALSWDTDYDTTYANYGYAYDEGRFDASPDNYVFCVQNLSGCFVRNRGSIICQSAPNCRIVETGQGYQIVDNSGRSYTLEEQEKQIYSYRYWFRWDRNNIVESELPLQRHDYTSSWWLSNIQSDAGDSILLHYSTAKVLHESPTSYGYFQRDDVDESDNVRPTITRMFNSPYERIDTTYHKLIQTIESPLTKVVFYYKSNGNFIYPQLSSIKIFAKSNEITPVESFYFKYIGEGNRALLSQISHVGHDSIAQLHRFTYKTDYGTNFRLNNRDHWGFYSPYSTGRFPAKCNRYFTQFKGNKSGCSERYANDSTADNSMLTGIEYPSGLHVSLNWEPHDFHELSYVGRQLPHDEDYDAPPVYYEKLTPIQKARLSGKNLNQQISSFRASTGTVLTIDMQHFFETALSVNSDYHNCVTEWADKDGNHERTHVDVYRDNVLVQTYFVTDYTNRIARLALTPGQYRIQLVIPEDMLIENVEPCGYYKDFYFTEAFPDDRPDGYVNLSYNSSKVLDASSHVRSVGGVRIKKIEYQSGTTNLLTKVYDYTLSDNRTSSGVLAFPPRYYYIYDMYELKHLIGQSVEDIFSVLNMSSSGLPFVLNGGGHIEYERVSEYLCSRGDTINKVVHHYTCANDPSHSDVCDFSHNPLIRIPASMMHLTSKSYMRGDEYLTEVYSDEYLQKNNEYQVLEKQQNDTINGSLYTCSDYEHCGYSLTSGRPYKIFGMTYYRVIPYNKKLVHSSSEGTVSGKNDEWFTYSNNSYSADLNADMPITHSYLNSEGDTIVEHYQYVPASSKIKSCITTRKRAGESVAFVIDAYRIEYDSHKRPISKWVSNLNAQNLPTSINDIASLTPDLLESCSYFNNRVAVKTNHHSAMSSVILWSYANTYPIAEIENASWNDVTAHISTTQIQAIASALNPDLTAINNLRSQLPQSRIRTFTYTPLVGISSFTDENGETTYYSYDSFGNLSETYLIEDNVKKIISHQNFHWTNQTIQP